MDIEKDEKKSSDDSAEEKRSINEKLVEANRILAEIDEQPSKERGGHPFAEPHLARLLLASTAAKKA